MRIEKTFRIPYAKKMSTSETVPVVQFNVCGDGLLKDRVNSLTTAFKSRFGDEAAFVVKVPGRVNLIGEHIDYCGFPVFPMAVEKSMMIAFGHNFEDTRLNLSNVQNDLYPDFSCSLKEDLKINIPPNWHDYFLCGVKGVITQFCNNNVLISGMNVLIEGNIPPSSGLSSSSAMVCGAAVATSFFLRKSLEINKTSMARDCAVFERLIGTQGGGMDQAIQFLAEEGSAKFVEFIPSLKASTTLLPQGINFFISHSGAECNKGSTDHFNTRVLETRLSALLLASKLNVTKLEGLTLSTLVSETNLSLESLSKFTKENLKSEPYCQESVLAELSATSVTELLDRIKVDSKRFANIIESGTCLKLRDRAVHVFEEANRVYQFRETCNNPSLTSKEKIRELSRLMNESHASCRDLYECSCPELDALVSRSVSSGALGSRLTGAGWGGCTVSVVEDESVDDYRSKMRQAYPSDDFTFNTKPSAGITIFSLQ